MNEPWAIALATILAGGTFTVGIAMLKQLGNIRERLVRIETKLNLDSE